MQKTKRVIAGALLVSVFALSGIFTNIASAASLTSMSDNLSRQRESIASNHTIRFLSPSGVQTSEQIVITFTGFDATSVNAIDETDIDIATGSTNVCTTATYTDTAVAATATATDWGVSASGGAITLTAPSSGTPLALDRCLEIEIGTNATFGTTGVEQITNGTAATAHSLAFTGSFGDTGTLAVDITDDDQVVVTATVDPSITFDVIGNSIEFGPLNAAAARYADSSGGDASEVVAHTITAGTNATSGYIIYVSGATLTSGGNTIDAIGASNTASAVGTEQFGLRMTASGGSGAVDAPYSAAGFAYNGVASPDSVASAGGPSATTTYSARYIANIASNTQAGTYSTTLTYTGTATF